MTAWATLGLVAAGGARAPAAFLARQEPRTITDVALVAMARTAAGDRPDELLARLRTYRAGQQVNATIWTILALRQAGEPVSTALVRSLLKAQRPSGGWSWHRAGAADANDTAAAVQALRATGVKGRPIDRGVAFLRRHQNADGGFELTQGRLGHAIHRLGDPGAARRRPRSRAPPPSAISPACAARTAATATTPAT